MLIVFLGMIALFLVLGLIFSLGAAALYYMLRFRMSFSLAEFLRGL